MTNTRIRERLEKLNPNWLSLFTMLMAFSTYTFMYAFRKPYTAATFAEAPGFLGLGFKEILVISQVAGYALSKFIGIKVVSEMDSGRRARILLLLIGVAELALLGFALVPPPYSFVFLFLNGLPLGMIWGLTFSYVEGRKQTEVIGLGLCASFIFGSGFVKDVGKLLMEAGISEYWMPFTTGLVFSLPIIIVVYLLNQVPPPTLEDEAARTKRVPMSGAERKAFFKKFAVGLILLIIAYTALSAYRDFRDNFLADIWGELSGDDYNFSQTETPASIIVLLCLMLLVLVKDNFKALMYNHVAIFLGFVMAGLSTWAFQQEMISAYLWILMTGIATYVAYIPFNTILFDRMIATTREASNVGFLIYLADAFGYLGSVSVLLYKDFGARDLSWVEFFTQSSYALAWVGGIGTLLAMGYFARKLRMEES
ncbi:MAG: DUF5690 family protein [Bacteroidia bacterium]|nr:DUF5690 family protein [Bacteroidia bacterium]